MNQNKKPPDIPSEKVIARIIRVEAFSFTISLGVAIGALFTTQFLLLTLAFAFCLFLAVNLVITYYLAKMALDTSKTMKLIIQDLKKYKGN